MIRSLWTILAWSSCTVSCKSATLQKPRSHSSRYMTWSTAYPLLLALSMHRRVMSTQSSLLNDGGLPSLSEIGVGVTPPTRPASGYGWSRWWRRAPVEVEGVPFPKVPPRALESPLSPPVPSATEKEPAKHYAKTLRLSSGQLVSTVRIRM